MLGLFGNEEEKTIFTRRFDFSYCWLRLYNILLHFVQIELPYLLLCRFKLEKKNIFRIIRRIGDSHKCKSFEEEHYHAIKDRANHVSSMKVTHLIITMKLKKNW